MFQFGLIFIILTYMCSVISTIPITLERNTFNLVILHNNDMHGRFEQTSRNSGTCQLKKNNTCVGGFARTAHVIREFRNNAETGDGPPVLYLNAGDTFTGTSWFSLFTWNITSVFLNALKPDAMSLGNHEFDLKPSILAKFINEVKLPIVAANLDFSLEPELLNSGIEKSIILTVSEHRIGVIGYLTPETKKIAQAGNVIFNNEIIEIRKEAKTLTEQGVKIIIALGHSGYEMDKEIAKEIDEIDIVIGGHTNTFLWNGKQPDVEKIEDLYPKVITQKSGKKVPVVQAYAYTKYLGVLNVTFNDDGDLIKFLGQPILLDNHIPEEPDVLELLDIYRPAIDALNHQIVGVSKVYLDGDAAVCRKQECNLGNLITDAHVAYIASVSVEQWTMAPIGLYNGGGIRNSITPDESSGKITRADLIAALPFGNQVIVLTLTGADLLYVLEQMVRSQGETSNGEFPQVSGIELILDMSQKPYSRVHSVKVRCGICHIPIYEPVDFKKNYTLVTSSFLADGGDNITALTDRGMNKKVQDISDIDLVAWYIEKYSPIYPEVHGRIRFVGDDDDANQQNSSAIDIISNKISMLLLLITLTFERLVVFR